MASFLQLCQDVARESGTVSGVQPATVTAQTGRLYQIVKWTAQAWNDIQNRRPDWLWLQGEFSGQTVASTQRYTGADLALTRHGEWVVGEDPRVGHERLSIYLTATGQSDERPLTFVPWEHFFPIYLRGATASETGYPAYYSVDPDNRLVLHPTPDAAYTLRGLYKKTPQTLSANGDTPEMPERFHDLIVWSALLKLAGHDESMNQPAFWGVERRRLLTALERDQLPRRKLNMTVPLA